MNIMVYPMFFFLSLKCSMSKPSTVSGKDALIEIVLYEETPQNGYETSSFYVQGHYLQISANQNSIHNAQGRLIQMDEKNICTGANNLLVPRYEYGWIGYIKLPNYCLDLSTSLEELFKNGAAAILIESTYDTIKSIENTLEDLEERLIVFTKDVGHNVEELINKNNDIFIRIQEKQGMPSAVESKGTSSSEYFDMGVFMGFFLLVCIVSMLLLIKMKWRQRRKKMSLTRNAKKTLKQMEVRCSFEEKPTFSIKNCAVCLNELNNGKKIRVLPCHHEFHVACVDPWLIENYTCPLCMFQILDSKMLRWNASLFNCFRSTRDISDEMILAENSERPFPSRCLSNKSSKSTRCLKCQDTFCSSLSENQDSHSSSCFIEKNIPPSRCCSISTPSEICQNDKQTDFSGCADDRGGDIQENSLRGENLLAVS